MATFSQWSIYPGYGGPAEYQHTHQPSIEQLKPYCRRNSTHVRELLASICLQTLKTSTLTATAAEKGHQFVLDSDAELPKTGPRREDCDVQSQHTVYQ